MFMQVRWVSLGELMQVRWVSLGELMQVRLGEVKEGGRRHILDLKIGEDLSKRMQNALIYVAIHLVHDSLVSLGLCYSLPQSPDRLELCTSKIAQFDPTLLSTHSDTEVRVYTELWPK